MRSLPGASGSRDRSSGRPPCGCSALHCASYEDLEECGRLAKFPCAVGDPVYAIYDGGVIAEEVYEISILHTKTGEMTMRFNCRDHNNFLVSHTLKDFGESLFLRRSAAEQPLKSRALTEAASVSKSQNIQIQNRASEMRPRTL